MAIYKKVTDLAAQSGVHDTDTYHVVDTTDHSQDPAGSSNKITWLTLKTAMLGYFSGGTGITYSNGVISSDPTATQTLTNKTLTSPTINSPAITTPTITTPTINVGSDATGDLLYRSSGGALARLAVGSGSQVLGVSGGLPAFVAPPQTPSGTVAMFAGSSAPTNWLLCDGSAVSRTTYSVLFAAISTTYGSGNGSTTFNVPDLRGRVAVGKNAGTFSALGSTGGEETHVLTATEMPSHTHSYVSSLSDSGPTTGASASNPGTNATTGSAGSDGAHNNLQPYITLNYIIAI